MAEGTTVTLYAAMGQDRRHISARMAGAGFALFRTPFQAQKGQVAELYDPRHSVGRSHKLVVDDASLIHFPLFLD